MLDGDPAHEVFLYPITLPCQVNQAIGTRPTLPPSFHSRCINVVRPPSLNAMFLQHRALGERRKLHVVISHRKVDETQAVVATLVLRRLDNTMYSRLVEAAGEELHGVTRVDNLSMRQLLLCWLKIKTRLTSALSICLT